MKNWQDRKREQEMPNLTAKVVGEKSEGSVPTSLESRLADAEIVEESVKGRILMDYGDSGDGKSTRMHSFARFYYQQTGLPVRLVSAEDSSKMVFQDLIDAGIVEAVFLTDSATPLPVYERIAEGEWPTPGKYEEVARKVAGKDVVKRVQHWQKKEEWAGKVGAYIFEGLSTFCENALTHIVATGNLQREQKDNWEEEGRNYSAASQSAYGFVQGFGIKLLKTSGALPVERVGWTAHEAKGKDEFDGTPIRGPKLVGGAATNVIRKYVGVLLHTERMADGEIRVYFENHQDKLSPTVQWKAKTTSSPLQAGAYKKRFNGPYFIPKLPVGSYKDSKDGLIEFLDLEETIRTSSGSSALDIKK